MKTYFLLLLTVSLISAKANPPKNFDTTNSTTISLQGNGYLYPSGERSRGGNIGDKGLTSWKNEQSFAKVFFLPTQPGEIYVALKLKSTTGNSRLKVSLDDETKSYETDISQGQEFTLIPIGAFAINSKAYHHIVIRGVSKTGSNFPDIEAVVLSGSAAKNIQFNKSPYRGAPSTHLRYPVPGDSAVKWFYSEVMVPKEVEKSVNAYYETNGFNSGYMGIQINSSTERRFIFSIWSLYKTDNPSQIPQDYAVNLKKKGKDVFTGEFGNEGSGGHSHLVYPWEAGKTYRLLSGIKSMAGDSTTYVGYYATPDDNYAWHLISEWTQNKTDTKRGFRGLYSFVENFGGNGNDYFKAYYGNQWICTPTGNWIELTNATFSTTANPQKHQRYDYGAGVEGNLFYMYSGGFKYLNNIAPKDTISRPANNKAPVIDFGKL
jgi:hypothetical protein